MVDGTPHRVVDEIAGGIVGGVQGLVDSAAGAVKGAGKRIMTALDRPFTAVTGKEGPHRIVDRLADGAIETGMNFVDQGVFGTVKKGGETIMRALDHLPEQTGIPPKLPKILGK